MKNAARYVREAIASVLAQEFRDLELIVVDDGSTDGSRALVEGIRDARIRLIPGRCRGFAAAWNTALGAAKGDLVMECDADDLFPQGRVGPQVRFLDEHPEFGSVCGGFSTIDAAGRTVADLGSADPQEITEELLAAHTRTHLCTFAIRRDLAGALGGLREFFESGCDVDLQLRLAEISRVWYRPGSSYRYRLHDSSITHTQPSARRRFYEQYARDLRAQRAAGRPDDLQRGHPADPPCHESAPDDHRKQVQGMLLGNAWRTHGSGAKLAAIHLGLRAVAQAPASLGTWRSMLALILKPTPDANPRRAHNRLLDLPMSSSADGNRPIAPNPSRGRRISGK